MYLSFPYLPPSGFSQQMKYLLTGLTQVFALHIWQLAHHNTKPVIVTVTVKEKVVTVAAAVAATAAGEAEAEAAAAAIAIAIAVTVNSTRVSANTRCRLHVTDARLTSGLFRPSPHYAREVLNTRALFHC